MKRILLILPIFIYSFVSLSAQKVERGPYTLEVISEGIYQIQDYNSERGRGTYTNAEGQVSFNNCSDMYLIVGRDKALLIDLSNNVRWVDNAAESLKSLVYEYSRGRDLIITVTHSHGDHLGMLHAFQDDTKVHFKVPKSDFPNLDRFPESRTVYFEENDSFDLGGIIIKTLKVEGHTPGSTVFFVEGKNIVFSGDAIGSGSGVWIFSTEGFIQYKQGITQLINYINNPANGIEKEKLIIYGGHSWQGIALWPLGIQYILDMAELIRRIDTGSNYETTPMSGNQRLDTHYKYGIATITWNRASEKEYRESLSQNTSAQKNFIVNFDSSKEVSGKKFAIKDINPDMPRNWDEYNFVVLEFKITTSQRFHIGFTTDNGYNELRVVSYLVNGWNKLAIPLRFYRSLPDARYDVARTYNQPRNTGWIHLGGRRGELRGVDSIGIRMRVPINNPEFEIRNITLAVDDPGDQYLGTIPVVDEFGQHNLVDYPDKIRSIEQLREIWDAEDKELAGPVTDFNYSRYGGYKQKQVQATGFFRTEKIDGRWWFVDPDGYVFLSVGTGGNSGGGGNFKDLNKREGWLKELPPDNIRQLTSFRGGASPANAGAQTGPPQVSNTVNFGAWNLYRRYGDDYQTKSSVTNAKRMDMWGVNTGSSSFAQTGNPKPHMLYLRGLGIEASEDLMGLVDIYDPTYAARIDSFMRTSLPQNADNPWVIGYFVGNEPAWGRSEARLCDMILAGRDRPIKTELQKFLKNENTPERKKEFIYNTFREFLLLVKTTMRRYDPNHLILGIRFSSLNALDENLMDICRNAFDVLSFNCYDLAPNKAMMDRALHMADMPMIIGEYHFGTVDRGMTQSLWQVYSQQERGVAFRYYTEQAYAHPGLVGTSYFIWNDQDLMGRGIDGENHNCGIIDVTDRPYKHQVEAMKETAKRLYSVHAGEVPPFNQTPLNARGHGAIPDLWDTENVWEGYDWFNVR